MGVKDRHHPSNPYKEGRSCGENGHYSGSDLSPVTDLGNDHVKQFEQPKRTTHLNETCENCYFWDKEYWYTKSYLGQPEVPIENVHPCNRMPQPVKKKCSTDWCGEHKGE